MRRPICLSIALLVLVGAAPSAYGMGGDHPEDRPVGGSPDWPQGVVKLANHGNRIHGFWVNATDFFFYDGNTDVLNAFLEQYAKVPDVEHQVVLHPGVGQAQSPWWPGEGKNPLACQWKLNVLRRGWHPDAPRLPGKKGPQYVVTVEVYSGGGIDLAKVKIPAGVAVKAGKDVKPEGPIAKFIAEHEAKRKKG